MSLKIKSDNGIVTCFFSGTLNTEETLKIESEVLDAVSNAKSVTFDMEGTEYIASSFLRICGKVALHREKNNFSIINVSENVTKIFKISGLYYILNVK
jgi:anti-anti-sigma factor